MSAGGREGREGREGRKEGGREEGREGEREGGREGGRERGKGREEGREGGREGERKGGRQQARKLNSCQEVAVSQTCVENVVFPNLSLVSDVDLSQQGTGESEHVKERLVTEGDSHFAVLGQRPHGLCLVHLRHQLVQDLNSYHTVIHRPLGGGGGERREGGRGEEGRGGGERRGGGEGGRGTRKKEKRKG